MSALLAATGLAAAGATLFAVAHGFSGREVRHFAEEALRPRVSVTRPAADDSNVLPFAAIAADLRLADPVDRPANGVDPASLADDAVRLIDDHGKVVPAIANTSGAGDVLVLQPSDDLIPGRTYTYEVTDRVRDEAGRAFRPFRMSFTVAEGVATGEYPAAFEQVPLAADPGGPSAFTALTIGPDDRLYAATYDGRVIRHDLASDGTLTNPATSAAIPMAAGGPRLVTGIAFSPDSTPGRLTLWVTHGQMTLYGAEDWTGEVGTLSGSDLSIYTPKIVGLPRAWKDHLTFQPSFGPDGAIYFTQGSHTSAGNPDGKWGFRPERLLTAAVLRLDPSRVPSGGPVDVRTADGGGTYDPYAENAPLTIYATGVRSAYDVLWHSNGRLYTSVNGAAAGGNAPGGPDGHGGHVPPIHDVRTTTDDVLLTIDAGAYYGHPNPVRGEFVLQGGNPTDRRDPQQISDYAVGTRPDPRWRPPTYVFGKNVSPNGMVEYRGGPVEALQGAMLVTRYSVGDDVVAIKLADHGSVEEAMMGIDGFRRFNDPLDIALDRRNGNLYVAEYGGRKLTLLRPVVGGVSSRVFRSNVPGR